MSPSHPNISPELRQLAQTILDRLDPAVRAAAVMATEALTGPSRCEQVWCPVCALAALVKGEQHPMLSAVAEHSVTLMEMLRALTTDLQGEPQTGTTRADAESPEATGGAAAPRGDARYQHIPIVIED